jgi:hypothetical protein
MYLKVFYNNFFIRRVYIQIDMIILYDWFIPFPISSAFRTILWHMVKIHWTEDIGPLFKITRQFELEVFYFALTNKKSKSTFTRRLPHQNCPLAWAWEWYFDKSLVNFLTQCTSRAHLEVRWMESIPNYKCIIRDKLLFLQ